MKKLIVMLTVCIIAIGGKVSAQHGTGAGTGKVSTNDFHFVQGVNKLTSADGKETVKIVKRGNAFSEVLFIDVAGKTTKLLPATGVIPGAPGADCSTGSQVQYFNNSTGTIGLFLCTNGQAIAKLDITGQPGATGKAQNRRVEVKLSK